MRRRRRKKTRKKLLFSEERVYLGRESFWGREGYTTIQRRRLCEKGKEEEEGDVAVVVSAARKMTEKENEVEEVTAPSFCGEGGCGERLKRREEEREEGKITLRDNERQSEKRKRKRKKRDISRKKRGREREGGKSFRFRGKCMQEFILTYCGCWQCAGAPPGPGAPPA